MERRPFIDPARVRKPTDKHHVERGIPYLRGRLRDLDECHDQAERWCRAVAGLRVHGTTRQLPCDVFEVEERGQLQPHEGVFYDLANR